MVTLLPRKDAVPASNLDLAREALVPELGAAREVRLAALLDLGALDNLYVATGVKRAHVAAAVVAMPCFVASWRSAALTCVGTLYPILLAANACSDDKAAAARKNLLLYFVLASLHQLVPVCWWVPFNVQFAATLFLVHFEGAAALFDFFLKAYFEPAEACTAIVRTAKKATLGVLS